MFLLSALLAQAITLTNSLPLLATTRLWYAAPLIVSVSLVYAATRHEEPGPIFSHALRFAGWVLVFMAIVTLLLQVMWWRQ